MVPTVARARARCRRPRDVAHRQSTSRGHRLLGSGGEDRRAVDVAGIYRLERTPATPLEALAVIDVTKGADQVDVHDREEAGRKTLGRRLLVQPVEDAV